MHLAAVPCEILPLASRQSRQPLDARVWKGRALNSNMLAVQSAPDGTALGETFIILLRDWRLSSSRQRCRVSYRVVSRACLC